jgi:hypothetical protein
MHFGCTDAFERQYDASGRETAIVQSERTKIRTGYLNSTYQVKRARVQGQLNACCIGRVGGRLCRYRKEQKEVKIKF